MILTNQPAAVTVGGSIRAGSYDSAADLNISMEILAEIYGDQILLPLASPA